MKRRVSKKLIKGEKGQALITVLILMLVGGLIIAPMLSHMGTGLKMGKEVFEEKMHLLYAADSGVEDALWQMKNDQLTNLFSGYDPYDYEAVYPPYSLPSKVNDKDVEVTLKNIWIPKGIAAPSPEVARSIIEEGKLVVFGSLSGTSQTDYQIKIAYYYGSDDPTGGNLKVEKIGIWLPPGFHYDNNCNLTGACAPSSVKIDPYKSGEAVVWSFGSLPQFKDFPSSGSGYPMVKTVTFKFSGPSGQNPATAVSWIDTSGVSVVDYAWDADTKVYEITSMATGETGKVATVEAYVAKIEMRDLGSAISGDYKAVGGTLMTATATTGDDKYFRNRLYLQRDATIAQGDIPATATVEAAYLYWSGWIDFHCKEKYYSAGKWKWRWKEMPELKYNPGNLTPLVETNAKVNRVLFGVSPYNMTQITTHQWQVKENQDQAGTWSYSCFYDATDLVKQLVDDEKLGSNGSGTYTLKQVVEDRAGYTEESPNYSFELFYTTGQTTGQWTGYPLGTPADKLLDGTRRLGGEWAYAGWSLILIYSSPEEERHQLYLYDDFVYSGMNQYAPLPNGGIIGGFIAPEEIKDAAYAARLTCFVGEGDEWYDGDYIKVNLGAKLWDGTTSTGNSQSNPNNVWNSKSVGLAASGVDIDTFTVAYPTIQPGDTSAQVTLYTASDSWNLIYMILSFRSEVTSGGTLSYLVR